MHAIPCTPTNESVITLSSTPLRRVNEVEKTDSSILVPAGHSVFVCVIFFYCHLNYSGVFFLY